MISDPLVGKIHDSISWPLSAVSTYLRTTANSLDKVKRSLLLLGNMAAKMSVNRPDKGEKLK